MDDSARESSVSGLLVGGYEDERWLVEDVFRRCGWRLFEAPDRLRATRCLKRHAVQVVIARSDMPDWSWQEIFNHLRCLTYPPPLIVTSRTDDHRLWAEVLNIGGYDVLAQPFVRDEMVRAVFSACHTFQYQLARATAQAPALAAEVA